MLSLENTVWNEKEANFARERLHLTKIPDDEIQLTQLCSELFYNMRHKWDFFSMEEHKASEWGYTRDWFISLHNLVSKANSFLELGTGSGYVLRVALKIRL